MADFVFSFLIKPHSNPNGILRQCSWTLAPANILQVSIMQQEVTKSKAIFEPTLPKKSGVDGGYNVPSLMSYFVAN